MSFYSGKMGRGDNKRDSDNKDRGNNRDGGDSRSRGGDNQDRGDNRGPGDTWNQRDDKTLWNEQAQISKNQNNVNIILLLSTDINHPS